MRPAADLPGAADLVARWHWDAWATPNSGSLGQWTERLRGWCRVDGFPILLVAVVGDAVAGSVSLVASDMPADPTYGARGPWLSGLYVPRDRRRQGIGTLLVGECERHAASCGISDLLLYTGAAQRLYERLGWSVMDHVVYDDEKSVVMSKRLAPKV